jgi:hypothetical protein
VRLFLPQPRAVPSAQGERVAPNITSPSSPSATARRHLPAPSSPAARAGPAPNMASPPPHTHTRARVCLLSIALFRQSKVRVSDVRGYRFVRKSFLLCLWTENVLQCFLLRWVPSHLETQCEEFLFFFVRLLACTVPIWRAERQHTHTRGQRNQCVVCFVSVLFATLVCVVGAIQTQEELPPRQQSVSYLPRLPIVSSLFPTHGRHPRTPPPPPPQKEHTHES